MRRFKIFAATFVGTLALVVAVHAADEPTKPADAAHPAAGGEMTPIDRVLTTEKGKLRNPFTDNAAAIAEGQKLYLGLSCNGCHGGGGGGGMCPSLTNEVWVYGSDDDTLFRLITLGSVELQKAGYKRIATETVVGPMPPYRDIITEETKLWKVIAFIRSVFKGRPEKRNW
jgi:mono/diheme cytochrome c family protein